AIKFPCTNGHPHLIDLQISTCQWKCCKTARSEMHMDHVSSHLSGSCKLHIIHKLDGMHRPLPNPYGIFTPGMSNNGLPFTRNKCISSMVGSRLPNNTDWKGDIIIVKYRDNTHQDFLDLTMSEFPIVKNYFICL
ncbi:hypothetical protein BKA93DRAFT_733391, partial [Sparassis latifolia]